MQIKEKKRISDFEPFLPFIATFQEFAFFVYSKYKTREQNVILNSSPNEHEFHVVGDFRHILYFQNLMLT